MCSSDHSHSQEFRVLPQPNARLTSIRQGHAALEFQVLPHLKSRNGIRVTTREPPPPPPPPPPVRALEIGSTGERVNNSLDVLFQVGAMLLGSAPQKHTF